MFQLELEVLQRNLVDLFCLYIVLFWGTLSCTPRLGFKMLFPDVEGLAEQKDLRSSCNWLSKQPLILSVHYCSRHRISQSWQSTQHHSLCHKLSTASIMGPQVSFNSMQGFLKTPEFRNSAPCKRLKTAQDAQADLHVPRRRCARFIQEKQFQWSDYTWLKYNFNIAPQKDTDLHYNVQSQWFRLRKTELIHNSKV